MGSENTGYNFLGTVISAGIVGFVLDKVAETQPWGLIGFMVIGLIYAVWLAQREMNPPTENPPSLDISSDAPKEPIKKED